MGDLEVPREIALCAVQVCAVCRVGRKSFIVQLQSSLQAATGFYTDCRGLVTEGRVERMTIFTAQYLFQVVRRGHLVRIQSIRAQIAYFLNVCHLHLVRWSCSRRKRFLGELGL